MKTISPIHEIINQNGRFPGTYYRWQKGVHEDCRNGWSGPSRADMIAHTLSALRGKGGSDE